MENTLEMTLEQAIAEIQDFAKETPMFVGSPKAAKIAEYLQELVDSRIKIKRLATELKADHQKAIDTANELAAYKDKTYITAEWLVKNGFEFKIGDKDDPDYYLYCDDVVEITAILRNEEAGIWEICIQFLDHGDTEVLNICTVGQLRMFLAICGLDNIVEQFKS